MVKKQSTEHPPVQSERRSFLNTIWMVLGAVALGEAAWLITSFLKPRKRKIHQGDFGGAITAGPVSSFTNNTVTAFPRGRFYLSRLDDGGFLAVSRQCTHLGCTIPWEEKEKLFICPCHASAFDIFGNAVKSPASRALDIFKVYIENQTVYVDTGQMIKRSEFRKEQAVYSTAPGSKA
ncbi:MAG: ubiquinol-cytochrome c reductase iron-sulfur subunit [Desulfobacteraceae bacterium]|nr:MAG: ubiquinol-cytochrome c reductase iron-sulfur subunit [Desulfobacteraceae bacterium]